MKRLLLLAPLWVLAYVLRPMFFPGNYSVNAQTMQTFQVLLGLIVASVILIVLFARSKFQK